MSQPITINPPPVPPPPPGLNIGEIYECLFRHKWKIILFTLAGIVAAACVYFLQTPVYVSEAKLFLRYVLESKPNVEPGTSDSQMRSPDSRGDNIINSEIEILTSMDLAEKVVDALGAEKILAKVDGGTNRTQAASYVRAHIGAESPKRSNVIRVTFEHPDRELPQLVLRQLIEAYRQKHVEIHRAIGIFDDFLTQQTDQMRARLTQTEDDLRKLKQRAGVASVQDTQAAQRQQAQKIRDEILNAEAQLAERQAILTEFSRLAGNQVATNEPANPETPSARAPTDKLEEYKRLSVRLEGLWKRYQDLTVQFTSESSQVKRLQEEIDSAEKQKKELEQAYPSLLHVALVSGSPTPKSLTPGLDFSGDASRTKGLEAKFRVLTNQFERVRSEAATLEEMESAITQMQRQRDLQEAQYRTYSAGLEQARLDEALGAAKTANISQVQAPAPPSRETKKLFKLLGALLVGGIGSGLALAFALDKLLNQTLRRPVEVETRLRLPLLLSLPDITRNGYRRHRSEKRGQQLQLPAPGTETGSTTTTAAATDTAAANGSAAKLEIAPWDPHHALRPYYESLRDRLITYFEVRNMTRKPKLVAVSGCNRGCGTTTLATGLAASLSDTGEGNVLLVDMNSEQGSVHPFYKGQPQCDLAGVLETEHRDSAMVQNNLYLVTEAALNNGLPRVLPKRFMNLVPKLKASDYDYIIFDMPPMSQTSVTPRLAGFMDMVLLVIESEKTNTEIAKRACDLLVESKANVSTVLNKRHTYVPKWLINEW